jgi:hypothetical protein
MKPCYDVCLGLDRRLDGSWVQVTVTCKIGFVPCRLKKKWAQTTSFLLRCSFIIQCTPKYWAKERRRECARAKLLYIYRILVSFGASRLL